MGTLHLNKLYYLLLALFLMAMTGCSSGSSTAAGGSGSLATKLAYNDGKSSAKTVALAPAGVTKIRMTVSGTGTNGAAIPVVRSEFDAAATSGTVNGIYPGTVTLAVQALNNAGAVLYEGYAMNLVVAANTTTDAGTITMTPSLVKAQDANCVSCHETYLDNSLQNLVANFKQSGHYTNSNWTANPKYGITGTGCAGCHGPQHDDTNPAASGRCYECHAANLSLKHTNPSALVAGVANPARFLNMAGTNCSACHEPHNPLNGVGKVARKEWQASGHGDINGLAWVYYDFTIRNTCNACHTPAGFLKAMGNGWTNTTAASTTVSSGKQPLTCDACHASDDFANSVRTLGAYKAGMGGYGAAAKASIQFPDVGESNLCIPCHAGRENGDSLKAGTGTAPYDFTNKTFVNPHYLAAAAVLYGKGGFQFYTSGVRYNTYGAAGKVGHTANWQHGRLGMDNYTTTTSAAVRASGAIIDSGNKGHCVSCHLGPKNTHSFGALEVANATMAGNTGGYTRGCYGCHAGSDMDMLAFIDEEKEIWNRMFDFYKWQFEQLGIYFINTINPYFFTDNTYTTSVTNWTTQVTNGPADLQQRGLQTMGAAMNLKLLVAERGSFAHNRAFGRALIADSLTFLQKGNVGNRSVAAADPNQIINFSAYSTARPLSYPGQVGPNISITQLKSYLTRSSGGMYTRR